MSSPPLISVLLPVYNGEQYLEAAIASILNQTCADFELLVLDDGSIDSSLGIASRLAEQDARLKVHHHANRGLCRTLQQGVSLATGKYIARMDADDLAHPDRFQRQVEYLEQHPNCVALGTAIAVIDPDGDLIHLPAVSQTHDAILTELLSWKGPRLCHPTVMMRAEAVRAVGGYVQDYHYEDVDLFLKLAQQGTLANLPERLLNYRWHLSSVSHTRQQTKIAEIEQNIALMYGGTGHRGTGHGSTGHGGAVPGGSFAPANAYFTPYESYCRWSILAHRSGFRRSSLKYLSRALTMQPLAPKSYWLLLNLLLGEPIASSLWNRLLSLKPRLRPSSPNA